MGYLGKPGVFGLRWMFAGTQRWVTDDVDAATSESFDRFVDVKLTFNDATDSPKFGSGYGNDRVGAEYVDVPFANAADQRDRRP